MKILELPGLWSDGQRCFKSYNADRNDVGVELMGIDELLGGKREEILQVAARHGARNVRVFGSVAQGEADESSGIDLFVELEPGRTLFDLGGLLMDLRDLLGRDVDVATECGLKPRIESRVLQEAVAL